MLNEIGTKYGKSAAQVGLRYLIQRGVIVIPKSTHKERMKENFEVFNFALTESDMHKIAALDKQDSAFFSHYHPAFVELIASMKKGTTFSFRRPGRPGRPGLFFDPKMAFARKD